MKYLAFSIHDVTAYIPLSFCGQWGLAVSTLTSLAEQ